MSAITENDMQQFKNMALPPQFEKALTASRSRFFGEVGAIYESATEIPITFIKVLMTKLQEQAKEIEELKAKLPPGTTTATSRAAAAASTTKKPNRAERRRSTKKQAKKSKPKSEISNSI